MGYLWIHYKIFTDFLAVPQTHHAYSCFSLHMLLPLPGILCLHIICSLFFSLFLLKYHLNGEFFL